MQSSKINRQLGSSMCQSISNHAVCSVVRSGVRLRLQLAIACRLFIFRSKYFPCQSLCERISSSLLSVDETFYLDFFATFFHFIRFLQKYFKNVKNISTISTILTDEKRFECRHYMLNVVVVFIFRFDKQQMLLFDPAASVAAVLFQESIESSHIIPIAFIDWR